MKKGLAALPLAMLAAGAMMASTVQAKSTLVYCSEGSPEGFNPELYYSGTTFDASSQTIFNRLMEFKYGTTEVVPSLATSYDVSKDGLVYTFHLRHGVKFQSSKDFHPTRDFNADDVLFTFNRQRLESNPYHNVGGGSYGYFDDMGMDKLIKNIVKVDDYTVKFVLNHPNAPFVANLAMDFASIFSKQQADQYLKAGTPEKLDQDPVGTGPFQKVQYQKDSLIRYVAFKDYWKGKPKIDRLVFSITPDASVRYAKLKAGECDVMPYPNPADLKQMAKDPNIKLLSQAGLNVGYLTFNVKKKPFGDVKVRQALNYATDKKAIIDAVFQGAGTVAKNPIPPTMWSYNNSIKDYPFDPAKAKELLKEAGYPNGFSTTIWAMPVQRPYNPNARRMAEIIQEDWAKVGVKAKIKTYEWGEYLKRAKAGEADTLLIGWTGDNGDPDNFLYTLLSCDAVGGGNYSEWCNKSFDTLLTKAKRTSDIAKRTKYYKEAQVIFHKQVPFMPIANSTVYMPIRKDVKNYKIIPLGVHNFEYVSKED
ncbi:Periplasmic dipeptide transport protein precursor [Marinomonas spartinae]|uniref:Periplasmic dipeptide transport protein n=1 Tax=Marinomonas spartinae TaxID=1792290 RepID=A0A1A8T2D0_9GAMM|nr:ABC transporter substrate-binding protein [Marinomonas spartinae]SBS26197.1 Periplasmic dipeptide transport protein precursor [Marinomonas spartinae]SBS40024.1 Periplasmic dipeptide transport protein precursor [Marinomonas spartinae]